VFAIKGTAKKTPNNQPTIGILITRNKIADVITTQKEAGKFPLVNFALLFNARTGSLLSLRQITSESEYLGTTKKAGITNRIRETALTTMNKRMVGKKR